MPGVAFDLENNGTLTPTLRHVRRLAAVCTYGGDRFRALMMSDPPRRLVKRVLRAHIAPGGGCGYLAQYDMNRTSVDRRAAFLAKVEAHFKHW